MAPRPGNRSRHASPGGNRAGPLVPRLSLIPAEQSDPCSPNSRQPLSPRGSPRGSPGSPLTQRNSPRFGTPRDGATSPRDPDSARRRQERSVETHVQRRQNGSRGATSAETSSGCNVSALAASPGGRDDGQASARSCGRRPNPLISSSPSRVSPARPSRKEEGRGETPKRGSTASEIASPANTTINQPEDELTPSTPGRLTTERRGSNDSGGGAPPVAPRSQRGSAENLLIAPRAQRASSNSSRKSGKRRARGSAENLSSVSVERRSVSAERRNPLDIVDRRSDSAERRSARQSAPESAQDVSEQLKAFTNQMFDSEFNGTNGLHATTENVNTIAAAEPLTTRGENPPTPAQRQLQAAPSMDQLHCANSETPPCVNRSHGMQSPTSVNGSFIPTPMQQHQMHAIDAAHPHENSHDRRGSTYSQGYKRSKETVADAVRSARSSARSELYSQIEQSDCDEDAEDGDNMNGNMDNLIGKGYDLVSDLVALVSGDMPQEKPQKQHSQKSQKRPTKVRSPVESPVPWVPAGRGSTAAYSPDGPLQALVDLEHADGGNGTAAVLVNKPVTNDVPVNGNSAVQDVPPPSPEVEMLRRQMDQMAQELSQLRTFVFESQRPVHGAASSGPLAPCSGIVDGQQAHHQLHHTASQATVSTSRGSSLALPFAGARGGLCVPSAPYLASADDCRGVASTTTCATTCAGTNSIESFRSAATPQRRSSGETMKPHSYVAPAKVPQQTSSFVPPAQPVKAASYAAQPQPAQAMSPPAPARGSFAACPMGQQRQSLNRGATTPQPPLPPSQWGSFVPPAPVGHAAEKAQASPMVQRPGQTFQQHPQGYQAGSPPQTVRATPSAPAWAHPPHVSQASLPTARSGNTTPFYPMGSQVHRPSPRVMG